MEIHQLQEELSHILATIEEKEQIVASTFKKVHNSYRMSARNLFRYLVLRSFDLRKYHDNLSELGVSSLRTGEGYVYNNLYNVIRLLKLLEGESMEQETGLEVIGYKKSKKLLRKHANHLFSKKQKKTFTEIMVTLPTEASTDIQLIRDMAHNGMEVARINLGHDDETVWELMVENIKAVNEELQHEIKVYMDLAGPKIRTALLKIPKNGKTKHKLPVRQGERLLLKKEETKGKASTFSESGEQLTKGEVGLLLPEIIDDLKVGDPVLFDDGMIRAKVVRKTDQEAEIELLACYKSKIGSHKGINLPKTHLNLPALTAHDHKVLPFVCQHADIAGYSFVRSGQDVQALYSALEKEGAGDLGVVFKIENQEAFENLPQILFEGMKRRKIGVMIARGDLAVEIGFERISEVQQQILWLCEAAHIPVIWATQVLENLAKTGMATRAEISDAALGVQAECVMLNKGPHILQAIKSLKNILIKMESHSFKRKNELRPLALAKAVLKRMG
jgi:pyruvate kinase